MRERSNFVETVEVKQCAALSFYSQTANSLNSTKAHAVLASTLEEGGVVNFMPQLPAPSTHWIGGSAGPIVYVDAVNKREISCPCWGIELQLSGHPACTVVTIVTPV
jgi:hypothetical protein